MASPILSVIIPAYNEAEHIRACLAETCRVLQRAEYEIIVVDDGSQDATASEAQVFASHESHVRVLVLAGNRGKGAALIQGSSLAQGELIAFLDADLELHPGLILRLWQLMAESQADIVIGSKHHPDSKIHYPTLRHLTSGIYARLIKLLFHLEVRDTQTGIKLLRASALQNLLPHLKIERFAFDLELLTAAALFGYKIVDSPVEVYFSRQHGRRLKLPAMLNIFADTLKIYFRLNSWKSMLPSSRALSQPQPIPPPPAEG